MIHVTQFQRRTVVGDHSVERLFEDVREYLASEFKVTVRQNKFISHGFLRRLIDIVRARKFQTEVNHVTGDVHYLTYLLTRNRTILTILDCMMLTKLNGFKRWLFRILWFWIPEKRCKVITVISESTRKQLLATIKCDSDKIKVIYCSVSEEFKHVPKSFNVENPRILQIGTRVNKNLERVVEALEGIKCELSIIGRLSSRQCELLIEKNLKYSNSFDLTREQLVQHYQNCDVVVFASTYEGFGLPIVEANAVGRPVVTSNLWSMPEIAGDAACLVDPFEVESIRAGVRRVLEDETYRNALVRTGLENAKRFQVKTIAEQYANLYRTIHSRAGLSD